MRAWGKDGHAEPAHGKIGPVTRTEYNKTEKTRAAKEYLATAAKYEAGVAFAQTQANDDDDKNKKCDRCGRKRHHLKDNKNQTKLTK